MKRTIAFLSLAALILASGPALAGVNYVGVTAIGDNAYTSQPLKYAAETTQANASYVLGGAAPAANIVRVITNEIFLSGVGNDNRIVFNFVLGNGGQWLNQALYTGAPTNYFTIDTTSYEAPLAPKVPCPLPTNAGMIAAIGSSTLQATILFAVPAGGCYVGPGWEAQLNPTPTPATSLGLQDTQSALANAGGVIPVAVQTQNYAGSQLDLPYGVSVPYLTSSYASGASVPSPAGFAQINVAVAAQKKFFLPFVNGGDTTVQDNGLGVTFKLNPPAAPVSPFISRDGTPWAPNSASFPGFYEITISGDNWDGVKSLIFDVGGADLECDIDTTDKVAVCTLDDVLSNAVMDGLLTPMQIIVDGTTPLSPRKFYVSKITYTDETSDKIKNTPINSNLLFTEWKYNGTTLFFPWLNANTGQFQSRIYVCTPPGSSAPGATITVYRVPVVGSTGTPLFKVEMTEPIAENGCLNFKIDDMFMKAGQALPYVADGGNIAIEMNLLASNAEGVANVLNFFPEDGPTAVGTYIPFIR